MSERFNNHKSYKKGSLNNKLDVKVYRPEAEHRGLYKRNSFRKLFTFRHKKIVTPTETFEVKPKPFLEDNVVKTLQGQCFKLSELWAEKTVILKVLPRLGCRYCQHDARLFSDLALNFDPQKITLAAVTFETPDMDRFIAEQFWAWELYIDPTKQIYKDTNCYRLSKMEYFKDVLDKRIWDLTKVLLKEQRYFNTISSDLYQLGGTFIITPDGKVIYKFIPTRLAMFPNMKEIFLLLDINTDGINKYDETPKESIFETWAAEELASFKLKPHFVPLNSSKPLTFIPFNKEADS